MTLSRAAALEALVTGTSAGGTAPSAAPAVVRTGAEVEAGGTVARLLIDKAILSYRHGSGDSSYLVYPKAKPGDVVLLSAANAARLDAAGITVDPDTDLEALAAELDNTGVTDAQLEAMTAPELIAYVGQNPEERDRVRTLEEARAKPRVTVLGATEPTPELDAEAAAAGTPGVDGATDPDGIIPE